MKRMFTKQFVCCLLLILYMVLLCQTAIADMLTVTDGHICGSITVQKGNMSQESITETFLIDCPRTRKRLSPRNHHHIQRLCQQKRYAECTRRCRSEYEWPIQQ